VNFVRRLALQKKKPDDSSRLDVVEIAHVPDMLPRLFPTWWGLRAYQHPGKECECPWNKHFIYIYIYIDQFLYNELFFFLNRRISIVVVVVGRYESRLVSVNICAAERCLETNARKGRHRLTVAVTYCALRAQNM